MSREDPRFMRCSFCGKPFDECHGDHLSTYAKAMTAMDAFDRIECGPSPDSCDLGHHCKNHLNFLEGKRDVGTHE